MTSRRAWPWRKGPSTRRRESIDLIATEGTEITESETLLCVLGDLCGHSWDHVNRSTPSVQKELLARVGEDHGLVRVEPERFGEVERGEAGRRCDELLAL